MRKAYFICYDVICLHTAGHAYATYYLRSVLLMFHSLPSRDF